MASNSRWEELNKKVKVNEQEIKLEVKIDEKEIM